MWAEDNVCPGKPEQGSDTLEVELKVELSLLMQVLGTKCFFCFEEQQVLLAAAPSPAL